LGYVDELREMVGHRPIILVGSVTIIVDDMGRLLLQQRKEPRRAWGITGGLMELGESTEDTG
jgi:8-oxo-dGTP pyrophosphatase MutT (NUDIX family)